MKFRTITNLTKEKGIQIRFHEGNNVHRLISEKSGDVLDIAVPKKEERTRWKIMMLPRTIVTVARRYEVNKLILEWKDFVALFEDKYDAQDLLEIFVVNMDMASYQFNRYKEKPKDGWKTVEDMAILVSSQGRTKLEETLGHAKKVAEAISISRDLSNTPGGYMTPELLAQSVKRIIHGLPIRYKVLRDKEMKRLGMGGVLGVAQGSKARPRFIILEYMGSKNLKEKPIVLIGKGVTFDSGGIDIKPSPYGLEMNMDMSGGAAVAASLVALVKMKVKKNIVVLIPAVENMPSGESYRPGDVLKSLSGKTIEVLNTDAEGRIILADALAYAKRYDPKAVIDVATLTGAAEVALGKRASAVFSPQEDLLEEAKKCGEESGDRMWPFPLWEEYEGDVAGNFGDVANMQTKGSWREGGTIIAAVFLWQFSKDFRKWLHIDMAPRMTPSHDEMLAKGAAGAPVRFLIRFVEHYL